jgi:hypothetical protein
MKAYDESQRNKSDDGEKTETRFSEQHGRSRLKVGRFRDPLA